MILLRLAFKSLMNRRVTTGLTVLTIAISVALLLGIERIRDGARRGFERTVSGVDLIVGARSGNINLLLYSVFHMGNATNNITWKTYEAIQKSPMVKWAVPISLGDSHRGFRVVGTTADYFDLIKYGGGKALAFTKGTRFAQVFEVVLGSDVAETLHYDVGQRITLAPGTGEVSFQDHANKPFTVVGILKPTGTPIDRGVLVSLGAIEAIHVDWENGAPPMPGHEVSPEEVLKKALKPTQITAFFVGLKSKIAIFRVQRDVNEYAEEPLSAILPGASLAELWQLLSAGEKALMAVSFAVFACSLVAMLLALLTTLNERRREMAILRSIGVRAPAIFFLIIFESGFLALMGVIFGVTVVTGLLAFSQPTIEARLGLAVELFDFGMVEAIYVGAVLAAGILIGVGPAWRVYRNSLSDGLTVKV